MGIAASTLLPHGWSDARANQGPDPSQSQSFIPQKPIIPIATIQPSRALQAQVQHLHCWGVFALGHLAQKLAFISHAVFFHTSMQFLSILLSLSYSGSSKLYSGLCRTRSSTGPNWTLTLWLLNYCKTLELMSLLSGICLEPPKDISCGWCLG